MASPRASCFIRSLSIVAMCCAAGTAEGATTYEVSIVPLQSSLNTSAGLTAPLTGSLIGNFDPVSNPGGTQTRPGLIGGSGNNPISYTATLGGDGEIAAQPTGGFAMTLDTESLTFSISGLAIDLLGGETGELGTTITINYQSFHTVAPTAIFPGGFSIPIPIGAGSVDAFSATQTGGAVAGVLVPASKTTYSFAALVPVDLLVSVTFNGQLLGGTAIPFALPLIGTVDVGGESVVLTVTASEGLEESLPIDPPFEFLDQPLALPTVLPPGGTANLLFSGAIAGLSLSADIELLIVADAAAQAAPGDLNGDGSVGPADLALLLGAWGTIGPGDLNGDGVVSAPDLAILLGAWSGSRR